MATSIPNNYNHHIPVTPPPEHETFRKEPQSPHPARTQEMFSSMNAKFQEEPQQPHPQPPQFQQQPQPQMPLPNSPIPVAPITEPILPPPGLQGAPLDPRYLAMASRIAAYYQQRCQAVSNYQQQRCQAWANMHRQKCQEMMQAAMLVVAWYVRDRIQRRRRQEKRKFRQGLSQKCARSRVSKGDTVRRWVLDVPSDVVPQSEARQEQVLDQEEAEFTMDRESVPDKDAKLFGVADGLIRNQLAQVNVPILGVLSFEESESESEEEEKDDEEGEEEGGEDEYEDEEDYEDDEMEECHDHMDSEEVHVSSGKGTGRRTRSSAGS
jgi:hypothetical protein